MTTLPQTTGGRLTRPSNGSSVNGGYGGGTAVAVHAHPAAGTATPAVQMTPGDAWRVVRSNLWLIVLVTALFGGIGFGIYWYLAKNHPLYTANGLVEVEGAKFYEPLERNEPQLRGDALTVEQRTQAQWLLHDSLIASVLSDPNSRIRQTNRWFQEFGGDPVRARAELSDSFVVRPIAESRLLQVTMTARDPADAKTILETLVDQHLNEQLRSNRGKQDDRSRVLMDMRRRYESNLNLLQRDIRETVAQLSIDGMGTPGRLSTKEIELQDLIKTQLEMERRQSAARSTLESLVQQRQSGLESPSVEERVTHDPNVVALQQLVNNLDVQLSLALSLGPEHKARQRLQAQRDAAQHKLDEAKAAARASVTAAMEEELAAQVKAIEASNGAIKDRITEVKADLGELYYKMNEYLTKRDQAATIRELQKRVQDELDAISDAKQTAELTGASWAVRPETPDSRSFPRLTMIMGAAIMFGLMLSVGVAFLRELMDTSVRSPRDIQRVGQLNLLGMIPHESEDPQAAGGALPLVIAREPHSILAESFRQVRTRLQHAAALDASRSILVTSPGPGDGKTTVACNLAASLALNGRKILLVDANFRRPELHKVFALSGTEAGFGGVLSAPERFEAAVVETGVPNLSVLPAGPKPENPTELLESQLFIDFIDRALEEYDHVVFDGGPLLFVSEAMAMAPRVDGVVSVVRAKSNSRGVLQRLRDSLRQVKAEHLGVVLNGVRHHAGGYYNRNIKTYYQYQNGHAG